MTGDRLFTGVVGGKGKTKVSSIYIDQVAQVPDAAFDVGLGLKAVPHLEARGGPRHELHEALGALGGDSPVIEVGLGLDDSLDQGVVDLVAAGGCLDEDIVLNVSQGRLEKDPFFTDPELEFSVVRDIGEMGDSLLVDITVDVGPGRRREQEKQAQNPQEDRNDGAMAPGSVRKRLQFHSASPYSPYTGVLSARLIHFEDQNHGVPDVAVNPSKVF